MAYGEPQRIRVVLVGKAGEVLGAIEFVHWGGPERYHRRLVREDLLELLGDLLLLVDVGGAGELAQQASALALA